MLSRTGIKIQLRVLLSSPQPCLVDGEILVILETLRSNDADGDENIKKTIGFISKTTALHVHHTFLVHFFPFLHDYDVKMSNFVFYGGRKQATTNFYFSF